MSIFSKKKKTIDDSPPMHEGNILVVTSSPRLIEAFVRDTSKIGYTDNSDIMTLENGDFAVVLVKKE